MTTIEQALREFISTGRIARRPPIPLSDYLPPAYSLRDSRYLESTSIFGWSPLPITAEITNWKIINFQNVLIAIQQLIAYFRILNQHRLIVREILRRFIRNFQNLNIPVKSASEIQISNHNTLLKKLVYTFMCTIARPAEMLHSDIPEDEAKNMQSL
ncbi:MAG: hypothetical protein EZS28_055596, partial [Streblomastix strix]